MSTLWTISCVPCQQPLTSWTLFVTVPQYKALKILFEQPSPVLHLYYAFLIFKTFPFEPLSNWDPLLHSQHFEFVFPARFPWAARVCSDPPVLCARSRFQKCNALTMQVNQKLVCSFKVLFKTIPFEPLSNSDPLPHSQHFEFVFPARFPWAARYSDPPVLCAHSQFHKM